MTQELATRQNYTLSEIMQFGAQVKGASILPASYQNNPANVVIAATLGASMGLSPAESLYRINVIQGKPTASGELIASMVRKAGHKLRIEKDEKHMSVTASIVRADDPDFTFSVTRDRAWAEGMGLTKKDNYQKQPLTMLTWRAVTAVAREACPEALYGVDYTPDEMTDTKSHSKPKTVHVEAKVEQVPQLSDKEPNTDITERLRALFNDWRALRGLSSKEAALSLAQIVGARDMKSLTPDQQKLALTIVENELRDGIDKPLEPEAEQTVMEVEL